MDGGLAHTGVCEDGGVADQQGPLVPEASVNIDFPYGRLSGQADMKAPDDQFFVQFGFPDEPLGRIQLHPERFQQKLGRPHGLAPIEFKGPGVVVRADQGEIDLLRLLRG